MSHTPPRFARLRHVASALLITTALALPLAAGNLDPAGAPASTPNPSEPRIPIPTPGETVSFPIVIDEPGSYYLTQNLEVSTDSNAIEIQTSNVSLDLNGFTVSSTVGMAVTGNGIDVANCQNVTLRNGMISGFHAGVDVNASGLILIEDLGVDHCTYEGIRTSGSGVIRNCQVYSAGGSTNGETSVYGIHATGSRWLVESNCVTNMVDGGSQTTYGIYQSNGQAFVIGNAVITADTGIRMNAGDSAEYRDNLTISVTTDYQGGTDIGNNN